MSNRPERYRRRASGFTGDAGADELARVILAANWSIVVCDQKSGVNAKPMARELLQRGVEIADLRARLAKARAGVA